MAPTRSSLQLLPLLSIIFNGVSSLPSNSRYEDPLLATRDAPAFSPLGCFTDNENGVKILADIQTASDDMTIEKCFSFCSRYSLFGVEYGRECLCGNAKTGNHEVAASECSLPCAGNSAQKCGAGNRLNMYENANPVVRGPATELEGITSLGCFVDGDPRVLPYDIFGADDMTAEKCAVHCAEYDYFGTQWSRECYCGNLAPTNAAPASDCSMACSGNPDELCGAGQRLNVYMFDDDDDEDDCEEEPSTTSSTAAPSSTVPVSPIPTIEGFNYQGCFTDNVPHRVLSGGVTSDPSMTPAKCAASCSAKGYPWSGTEYGVECYCGHELNPASTKVDNSECSMSCGGDSSSHCGAGDRLSIYAANGVSVPVPAGNLPTVGAFRYASCWADDLGHRVLDAVDYRTDDMTIEKCAARCEDYFFFGLQYGNECYCGNQLSGGQKVAESGCGMLCVGKTDQLCGGPARLNLYTRAAASSTSSSSPSSSAPSSSNSGSSSSSAAASSSIVSSTTLSSAPISSSSSAVPASSASMTTPTPSSSGVSSTVSTPSSSAVPSSTTFSSSTTQPPAFTTITNCPSSSTVDGPGQCFLAGYLPSYCNTLTSANLNSRGLPSMLTACRRSITTYMSGTPSGTCFPASWPATFANNEVARETGASVLSCLRSSTCTFASDCKTSTYPTTAQIPSPTPSIGVNLLLNPSFELTDVPAGSNWTFYSPTSPNFPQEVTTLRSRTGTHSYRARYLNINGATTQISQVFTGLEPMRSYQARVWYSHTNANSPMLFVMQANPGGFTTPTQALSAKAVGTWHEMVLDFTAVSSFVQLKIEHNSQVVGYTGTPDGLNEVYVDDVWLSRVS